MISPYLRALYTPQRSHRILAQTQEGGSGLESEHRCCTSVLSFALLVVLNLELGPAESSGDVTRKNFDTALVSRMMTGTQTLIFISHAGSF